MHTGHSAAFFVLYEQGKGVSLPSVGATLVRSKVCLLPKSVARASGRVHATETSLAKDHHRQCEV